MMSLLTYKSIFSLSLVICYLLNKSYYFPFIFIAIECARRWVICYINLTLARRSHKKKLKASIHAIKTVFLTQEYEDAITDQLSDNITDSKSITNIIKLLEDKEISSENQVKFYLKRCIDIAVPLGAVSDFMVQSSIKFAKTLDEERSKGILRSKLHGLPISVKANIFVKGFSCHIGLTTEYKNEIKENALIIDCLEKLGCIPFVRSNCPTGSLSNDCNNIITGETKNCARPERSAGGSSGGEATQIYTSCSPLGIGTDAAGSIRTPALFQGIPGFVFSPSRITRNSKKDLSPKNKMMNFQFNTTFGVITKNVEDIELFTKSLVEQDYMYEMDLTLDKREWGYCEDSKKWINNGEYYGIQREEGKLRVCYIDKIEEYPPAKSVKNAMKETQELQEKNGHYVERINVEKWENPTWDFFQKNNRSILCNLCRNMKEMLNNNIINGESFQMYIFLLIPTWLGIVISYFLKLNGNHNEAEKLRTACTQDTSHDLLNKIGYWELFRSKVNNIMKQKDFDAMILPGGMMPAFPKGMGKKLTFCQAASFLPNSLKMCMGCVPVRKANKEEEFYITKHNGIFTRNFKEAVRGSRGLPVGVTICSLEFEEEKCLKVMKEVQRLVEYRD